MILKNITLSVAQIIISSLILFFLYQYLLHSLGVELLGVWALVLSVVTSARIAELGLSGSIVKFVAKYIAINRQDKVSLIVQTALISIAIFFIVVLAVVFYPLQSLLAIVISGNMLNDALILLPYALLSLYIGSLSGVCIAALEGCQRFDQKSLVMILASVLNLSFVYLLVPKFGLLGVAYAQIIQVVFTLIASWLFLRRELPLLPVLRLKWDKESFKEMFGYSINFQVISLISMLYEPMTKAMLAAFGSLTMVGYYEMASRMILQLRAMIIAANQVIVPVVAIAQEKDANQIISLYKLNLRWVALIMIPIASAVTVLLPVISEVWIGRYEPFFHLASISLMLGYFLNVFAGPAYFSYLGIGRLKWNTVSHVMIAVLNLIFGLLAGTLFGGEGILWAWSLALTLGSIIIIASYHSENHISYGCLLPKESFLIFIVAIIAVPLGLIAYDQFKDMNGIIVSGLILFSLLIVVLLPVVWFHPLIKELIKTVRVKCIKIP